MGFVNFYAHILFHRSECFASMHKYIFVAFVLLVQLIYVFASVSKCKYCTAQLNIQLLKGCGH